MIDYVSEKKSNDKEGNIISLIYKIINNILEKYYGKQNTKKSSNLKVEPLKIKENKYFHIFELLKNFNNFDFNNY